MKKSLIVIVALAATALFGASVYASPYWALDRLKLAAEPGDKPPGKLGDAGSKVLRYRSWSVAAFCEPGRESEGCLVFTRVGLWSWRLAAIEIPQALPAAG